MVSKRTEDILTAVGVVGALGIGGYAVYRLVSSLTTPGCTTPGTACYAAIQPELNALQACMNEWTSTLNAYLQEDNQAGTSLTQAQQANLNYIMNSCIIPQEKQLSKNLQPYNWQANMVTVAQYVVITAGVLVFVRIAPSVIRGIVNSLRTSSVMRTGPEMGSATTNMALRVSAPELDSSTLSAWADTGVYNWTSNLEALDASSYQALVEQGIITADTADTLYSTAVDAMEADAEDTAVYLAEFL
jgi:hypothetical protein